MSMPPPPMPSSAPVPPPAPYPGPVIGYASGTRAAFESSHVRGRLAIAGLVAMVVAHVAIVAFNLAQLSHHRAFDDSDGWYDRQHVMDLAAGGIGLVTLGAFVFTVVTYLMWVHRVHRNLPALVAGPLRFTPGWAVGYYFIPIINLFRPYQAMTEAYNASRAGVDGSAAATSTGWDARPTGTSLIGWWWATWIVSNVIDRVAFRMATRAGDDPDQQAAALWAEMTSAAVSIVAAVLLVRLIRRVTELQARSVSSLQQQYYAAHGQYPQNYAYGYGQPPLPPRG